MIWLLQMTSHFRRPGYFLFSGSTDRTASQSQDTDLLFPMGKFSIFHVLFSPFSHFSPGPSQYKRLFLFPRATSRADMLACLFGGCPKDLWIYLYYYKTWSRLQVNRFLKHFLYFPERLYALYQHALAALSSRNRKKTGKPGHASQLFKRTQNNDLLGRGLRRNTEGRAGIIYQKLGIFRRTQISLPVKGFNICKR